MKRLQHLTSTERDKITIGLIRRFFSKGTNFDNISEEAIAYVEDWINNRPMKILNYMISKQIFQLNSVAIAS